MTEFEGREKAFEKKFEIDEELKFKVTSKASHLFGEWAAKQMALPETSAENYSKDLLKLSLLKGGHELLMAKVESDFDAKGLSFNRSNLEKEMENFLSQARNQIIVK